MLRRQGVRLDLAALHNRDCTGEAFPAPGFVHTHTHTHTLAHPAPCTLLPSTIAKNQWFSLPAQRYFPMACSMGMAPPRPQALCLLPSRFIYTAAKQVAQPEPRSFHSSPQTACTAPLSSIIASDNAPARMQGSLHHHWHPKYRHSANRSLPRLLGHLLPRSPGAETQHSSRHRVRESPSLALTLIPH